MNVLIAMPLGEFGGGAERMLLNYLSARRTQNSQLNISLVFLSPGSLVEEVQKLGYTAIVLSAGRVRQIHRLLYVQYRLGLLIAAWKIHRVLAWMPKACAYVTFPARMRQVPLYLWRHDIPWQLDRLDKWVFRYGRPAAVACSSRFAEQALQSSTVREVHSCAIHPGVERHPYNPTVVKEIRSTLLDQSGGVIVGTVTRLQPWKRVDLFLRAAAELKQSVSEVKALIVGGESHGLSSGHEAELRALGYQLLGDNAIFVGEQRDVGNWLQAMDVFVLPSEGEPFGMALVEALMSGKPVVACGGGGPEEILSPSTVGRLLPANPSPAELARAMEDMLDPALREDAKVVNQEEGKRFSTGAMATKIDEWLQS